MLRLFAASVVLLFGASQARAQAQGPAAKPMPPVDAQPSPAPGPAALPPPAPDLTPTAPAPGLTPTAPAPGLAPAAPPAAPPAQPPAAMPGAASAPPQPPGAAAPGAPPPQAALPIGTGLTIEVGLGIGRLRVASDRGGTQTYDASGLGLGVGLWLSPRNALSLRISGGSHRRDGEVAITASMLSVALQHWLSRTWWVGASVGSGALVYEYLDDRPDPEPQSGLGLELRAGYRFGVWGKHALSVALDATTVFLEDGSATAAGLLLAYQYL